MEPQLPSPQHTPEMGPQFKAPEAAPMPGAVEAGPQLKGPERGADAGERPSQNIDNTGAPQQAPVTAPPPLPPSPAAPIVQTGAGPSAAADEDLIEKEWVEKAKQVIADTRHDPYLQEREVSKLQADYLKKRYGKDIKLSSEG